MPSDSLYFVQSNAERTQIPRSVKKKKEKKSFPFSQFFPFFLVPRRQRGFYLFFFELFLFCFVVGVVL